MKINTLKFILLLFLPFIISAQKVALVSVDIGITASHGHFTSVDNQSYFFDHVPSINNTLKYKANYNVAVHYERGVTSYLFLKAGIEWASHGYRMNKILGIRWPNETDGNGGWLENPDYIHEYTPKVNLTHMLVPFAVRLEYPKGKLRPYVEVGLGAGFEVFRTENSLTEQEVKVERKVVSTQITVFNNLAIGMNYRINEKTILYVQPHGQFELFEDDFPGPNENFYSLGLRLGARYSI